MRRAKLTIDDWGKRGALYGNGKWCRLTARNGETLMHGEIVAQPKRARATIIRAMVDILTDEGYVVTKAEEAGR